MVRLVHTLPAAHINFATNWADHLSLPTRYERQLHQNELSIAGFQAVPAPWHSVFPAPASPNPGASVRAVNLSEYGRLSETAGIDDFAEPSPHGRRIFTGI